MAITYTWDFGPLTTKSENGLTDVVKVVHWRFTGVDANYTATIYGTVSLDTPSGNTFTNFSSLSKTKVKEWVINKLDRTEVELKSQLAAEINLKKNPTEINKTAPWENN